MPGVRAEAVEIELASCNVCVICCLSYVPWYAMPLRRRGQGDPRGLDPGLSANSRAGRSVAVMTVDASQIGLFWVREWRLTRPVIMCGRLLVPLRS